MSDAAEQDFLIKPIAGALGAEIWGIDLSQVDLPQANRIREAFNRYHVLVFREQTLSPSQQKSLLSNLAPSKPILI